MHRKDEPWKWPVVVGLALALTLVAFLAVPRAWLGFLLPGAGAERDSVPAARRWLVLVPPPEVEVVSDPVAPPPDQEPPRPEPRDSDWWTGAWVAAPRDDPALFLPRSARPDTVALVLEALGVGDSLWARTRPDSVLAARLALLRATDALAYDALKPLLRGMARAEAYADILSRAADMYDEPLAREIRVPD